MVSIHACHACDPGSIPGSRIFFKRNDVRVIHACEVVLFLVLAIFEQTEDNFLYYDCTRSTRIQVDLLIGKFIYFYNWLVSSIPFQCWFRSRQVNLTPVSPKKCKMLDLENPFLQSQTSCSCFFLTFCR